MDGNILVKMSPRLKISSYVIERLSKLDTNESIGCLYGVMYDGNLLVVGLSLELFEREKNTYKQLLLHLPTEIELCGVIKFGETLTTETRLKEILQDVDITDNPLVIIINQNKDIKAHFLVHDKFEETKYEVLDADELWNQFLHVHLNTVVPLSCEATIAGVKNIMQNKRIKIASGQVSFHINGTSVYLFGVASDVGLTGISTDATVGELLDSMNPEQPKKKKHNTNSIDILPANLILKATKDILSDKLVKTAVKMMTTQRKPSFCISMPLRIDTLAIIHRNTKLLELYTVLVEAACRSLKLLESVLLEQLGQEGIGDGAGLRLPETFHFIPDELGHFVTRIVPKDIPDESMEKERRLLHSQLGLPVDRPMFRRGNAHEWRPARLLRAHAAPAARPGTRAARVRGRCGYYHYLQDGFHDDGWGCAYRSLQTIFSWFRYQGYTTVEVPSHREIQQCLVDIGDKPSSFVGSKQWIGSTEVSFCLETLLGVQSRIIFVNTGAELQSYTPELLHHFQKHGSPIMIGGGVLAHTIVGVELDAEGREARYLVLDPHYAGADEPAAVLARGGCGWKGADFWNKTAHYNLCLPQTRPAV
ncbi:probable Ufm1-specific protease 2 isoform X1 [Cydia pomonella]|uniref:probable Ufm1-specific protease 2 isoform X1 n=1 Tax=Cydia pomonella TaxID=82600 RepID=UPI002ADDEC2D|nr:probable Ufm1-specific protease 2 isoform X1 [Cydia pomonella]